MTLINLLENTSLESFQLEFFLNNESTKRTSML